MCRVNRTHYPSSSELRVRKGRRLINGFPGGFEARQAHKTAGTPPDALAASLGMTSYQPSITGRCVSYFKDISKIITFCLGTDWESIRDYSSTSSISSI